MSGAPAREVVIEVRRYGRRPRYHRGAQLSNGTVTRPEQCNTDQAGRGTSVLPRLPAGLPWPWSQLCHRCWRGTRVLEAALAAAQPAAERRRLGRLHRRERAAINAALRAARA